MSDYKYFSLQPLADGVWAALAGPNAGIVDLGDQTLIFDTCADLGTARELRAAAEALTGRRATYVINSHYHADHVHGNLLFADHAVLIASAVTREAMVTHGPGALERMKASMMAGADEVRRQLEGAPDGAERERLAAEAAEYDEFFANYPTPADLRLPTLTFERQLTFHGSRRTAQLITFGGAHSPCDAVLWLPTEQMLFTGDLVVSGIDLALHLGRPERWLPILEQMEALGARTLLPGHGPVVPAGEGFTWARQYLAHLFERAAAAVAAGQAPAEADQAPVPAGYRTGHYRRNLRFLMERLAGGV